MGLSPSLVAVLLSMLLAGQLAARDLYVDPIDGDDRADGLAAKAGDGHGPVKSIAYGLKYAQPGDTVHLRPTAMPYREIPVFHNRHGEPAKPITLDGHGATIEGAEPLKAADWTQVSPGLYRGVPLARIDDPIVQRYFFRIDGRMVHMGRTSKGPRAPWKLPGELQPGEWTYVEAEKIFYLRIDPALSLDEARIEAPVRSSGVQVSGDNSHLVIRNLIARHVYNDGYNIHGKCRDVLFENVQAIDCGDDGLSAHDDCRVTVRGMFSRGNSTGMCNVGDSYSDCDGVLIVDCLGVDYFMLDSGEHRLTNSLIYSSASGSIVTAGRAKEPEARCKVELDNVAVIKRGKNSQVKIQRGSQVTARHVASVDFDWYIGAGAECNLSYSALGGSEPIVVNIDPTARWTADHNWYDLKQITWNNTRLVPADFAKYQAGARQDEQSAVRKLLFGGNFGCSLADPGDVGIRPEALRAAVPNPTKEY